MQESCTKEARAVWFTEKVVMWNFRCMLGAAVVGLSMATAPGLAQGISVGNDGWTVVTPSPDSRMIYVSSSSGNDNNDGLSEHTPKRTLAAGYAMLRDGHADWLLLKGGDTWHESFPYWNVSGRSPSERIVVRSYGSGARARLLTGSETAIFINGNVGSGVRNLAFMDLHVNAHTNPGTSSATGFRFFNSVHDVLIENCYAENYRVNMIFQTIDAGRRSSNIEVRRSVIADALASDSAHAQGIYADGVDGLLMEENVFDMNGWSESLRTANIFRHNVYIQTRIDGGYGCSDVVTRGNITARASATGFMMRTGGVAEDNLFLQNPIGLAFGNREGPAVSGHIRNNVVLDGLNISPSVQRAWGIYVGTTQGVDVSGNIIAHQRSGTDNVQGIAADGTFQDLTIRYNIVYDWGRPGGGDARALAFFGTAVSGISVHDNHFQQPRGGYMVGHWATLGPAFTYSGNRYFSTNGGSHQFFQAMTYGDWVNQSGETNSAWGPTSYVAPDRDIAGYMASMGGQASLDAFMREARKQARNYWRVEYTAAHVNQWVRDGFGMVNAPCRADLNGDGAVNILDVIDFIETFGAGDPRADMNGDGTLNILDYIEYQRLMSIGCN